MEKTNVMRILDQKKIPYHHYEYDNSQAYSGTEVADMLGQDPKVVYKTLVTVAKSKKNYVFVIPVEEELDLKKAAKAANEKSTEIQRTLTIDRLCPWRMFPDRNEESVYNIFAQHGERTGAYHFQCRKNRVSGGGCTGGFSEGGAVCICGCDKVNLCMIFYLFFKCNDCDGTF